MSYRQRRCPRCRSARLQFHEFWTGTITFEQTPDGLKVPDFNIEPGDPTHVEGECMDCGHGWRVRGAHQIINIDPEAGGGAEPPAKEGAE